MSDEKKPIGSKKELEAIKNDLLKRKEELDSELAELYSQKVTDEVQDLGDQASSSSLETLKISLQDAELEEYNRILKAIEMIDEGTYGMCYDCSQPISEKRLKLYPNATRCLVCQELLEEKKES